MRIRAFAVPILCAAVCASAFAQDFRKVSWGMTPDQVTAAEADPRFARLNGTTKSILTSPVEVMGHGGFLNYIFEDGKLVIAQYRFDDDDEMRTYNEVRGALEDKYGAVDQGQSYSRWTLQRTFISLSSQDDVCRVTYADLRWIASTKEKQRAEHDPYF
ncbi:MAG TPA: hypothetical protein VMV03_11185 [Spirochaetia bacterium]|nr:hypothetical protein [Spirochaetia bacterium]